MFSIPTTTTGSIFPAVADYFLNFNYRFFSRFKSFLFNAFCNLTFSFSSAGFAGDTNIVTLITGDDETQLPLLSKEETAVEIMNKILEQTEKQL